jgi:hypothetical protein
MSHTTDAGSTDPHESSVAWTEPSSNGSPNKRSQHVRHGFVQMPIPRRIRFPPESLASSVGFAMVDSPGQIL